MDRRDLCEELSLVECDHVLVLQPINSLALRPRLSEQEFFASLKATSTK